MKLLAKTNDEKHITLNLLNNISKVPTLVITWLYVMLFYANQLLTNRSTPGGDAKRVLGYVESARESNFLLPLWDPFSAGGRPSLADPEWLFYRLLSPIINLAPSSLYNLSFNLTLLVSLLILSSVIYYLALNLKIKKNYAAVSAILFVCSGIGWSSIASGRINTILIYASGFLLLLLYKKWLHKNSPACLVSLLLISSMHIVFSGYYALVSYGFLFAFAIGCNINQGSSIFNASIISLKHLFTFGCLSILMGALFLFPLIDSQLNALVSSEGTGKIYQSVSLNSLYQLFIPTISKDITANVKLPYISFIIIPYTVLSFYFFWQKPKQSPEFKAITLIGLFYFAIGVGFGLADNTFDSFYSQVPILNLIRWGNVYIQFALLSFILILTKVISSLHDKPLPSKLVYFAYSLPFVLTLISISLNSSSFNNVIKQYVPILIILLLFTSLAFLISRSKYEARHKPILIICIGLSTHLATPNAFFWESNIVPRTLNTPAWPKLASLYKENLKGVRQYCPTLLFCPLNGTPSTPAIVSFSMHFSPEAHAALEMLTNKKISEKRPHWIGRTPCSKLDLIGLEMSSVRYLFCIGKQRPKDNSWILRGESTSNQFNSNNRNRTVSVWENDKITSPLKLFYSQTNSLESLPKEQFKKLWKQEIIAVDEPLLKNSINQTTLDSGNIALKQWDEENIIATVSTKTPAILYISALYDKGWQAKINQNKASIHRAFGAYQAIKLPSGESTVHIQYKPTSWLIGKLISILTLLSLLVFLAKRQSIKSNKPSK